MLVVLRWKFILIILNSRDLVHLSSLNILNGDEIT